MRYFVQILLYVVVILVWSGSIVSANAEQTRLVFFVANADRVTVTDGTIALAGSEAIFWVTDRPFRQSGAMPVTQFIADWSRGANDFADDPPTAVLTGVAGGQSTVAVIELTDPRLIGGDLVFDFRLLSGDAPAELVNVSVFIDSVNTGGDGGAGGDGGLLTGDGGDGGVGGSGGIDGDDGS